MSIIAWLVDRVFRLGMWFILDDVGRDAFWFLNTALMLSCITYLYFDFKSKK